MDCLPAASARVSAVEFAETHYKRPALVQHSVRCGKANCHCKGDDRHGPYAYLYWRDESGMAHRHYVKRDDVERVREIVELRREIDREDRNQRQLARISIRTLMKWLRELKPELYSNR